MCMMHGLLKVKVKFPSKSNRSKVHGQRSIMSLHCHSDGGGGGHMLYVTQRLNKRISDFQYSTLSIIIKNTHTV